MFTTPDKISSHVLEFCRTIAPESTPVYVPVFPVKSAVLGKAFYFVREYAEQTQTGRAQTGWTIWEWPDMALEAEHNCVYDAQDGGSLRELAPYPERRILFLPDDAATYDLEAFGWPRKSVRSALRPESVVHEYLGTLEMRDDFVRAKLPLSNRFGVVPTLARSRSLSASAKMRRASNRRSCTASNLGSFRQSSAKLRDVTDRVSLITSFRTRGRKQRKQL